MWGLAGSVRGCGFKAKGAGTRVGVVGEVWRVGGAVCGACHTYMNLSQTGRGTGGCKRAGSLPLGTYLKQGGGPRVFAGVQVPFFCALKQGVGGPRVFAGCGFPAPARLSQTGCCPVLGVEVAVKGGWVRGWVCYGV